MKGISISVLLAWALAARVVPLRAQGADAQRFEVVSIKRTADPLNKAGGATPRSWGAPGGRVTLMRIPLRYLLLHVFDLQDTELAGPSWIDDTFFDIQATVPHGARGADIAVMFQNMLADRFHLKYHFAGKGSEAYALRVAPGGLRLKEVPAVPADLDSAPGRMGKDHSVEAKGQFGPFRFTVGQNARTGTFEFASMTMPNLAQFLAQHADLPVVDMTALKESYGITLECSLTKLALAAPEGGPPEPGPDPLCTDSLKSAGLVLKREKLAVRKLIIDYIDRPTPN